MTIKDKVMTEKEKDNYGKIMMINDTIMIIDAMIMTIQKW